MQLRAGFSASEERRSQYAASEMRTSAGNASWLLSSRRQIVDVGISLPAASTSSRCARRAICSSEQLGRAPPIERDTPREESDGLYVRNRRRERLRAPESGSTSSRSTS